MPVLFLGVGSEPPPEGQTFIDGIRVPDYLRDYTGALDHDYARKVIWSAWRRLRQLDPR